MCHKAVMHASTTAQRGPCGPSAVLQHVNKEDISEERMGHSWSCCCDTTCRGGGHAM